MAFLDTINECVNEQIKALENNISILTSFNSNRKRKRDRKPEDEFGVGLDNAPQKVRL